MNPSEQMLEQMAAEIERLRQQNEDLLRLANRLAELVHVPNPFLTAEQSEALEKRPGVLGSEE